MTRHDENRVGFLPEEDPEKRRLKHEKTREEGGRNRLKEGSREERTKKTRPSSKTRATRPSSSSLKELSSTNQSNDGVGPTSVRVRDEDPKKFYDDARDVPVASAVNMDYNLASNNPVYQAMEFDPSKKPRAVQGEKRNSLRKYGLIGLLISGVIALIVVIVVQQKKNGGATPSSLVPTLSPTFMRDTCISARIQGALLSDLSVLDDPTSPQSRARDWILYNDPGGLLDCTSSNLIQRWALVTFYFSMTKDNAQWLGCAPTEDPIDTDCVGYTLMDELRVTPINDRTYIQDIIDQKQWLKDANECFWYGAYCEDGNDVSELTLFANDLKGTIPKDIGVLTDLEFLAVSGNELTGTIPTELGFLNIIGLEVDYNQLTGTIPEEIYDMKDIELITLEGNSMSGTVSTRIGEFPNLVGFFIGDNIFEGSIPSEIGNNIDTVILSLFTNNFSGSIPPEIGNLAKLERFSVEINQLSGTLPKTFKNLLSLNLFRVDDNRLVGKIPDELYRMTSLDHLILNSNQFIGQIHSLIGNMKKLQLLYIANNDFTGPIPTELGKCRDLREVSIELNRFTGPVPSEVCDLSLFLGLKYAAADCNENFAVSSGLGFNQCDCCTVCCDRNQPTQFCEDTR